MTKARARERAKARALKKPKIRDAGEAAAGDQANSGRFDPNANAIKGPGGNSNAGNFGGARRGAARSK